MRRSPVCLLLGAMLLPGARALVAQGAGQPASAQPSAGGETRRLGWRLGLEGGSGFESNPRYQLADGAGDMVQRLHADAAGGLRLGKTIASVTAGGDVVSYRTLRDLDRFTYQAGLGLMRPVTRRLTMQVGGLLSSLLSPEVTQGGVALPLTQLAHSRTRSGAASAVYRLSPLTTASATGSFTELRYDLATLAGGTTTTADVGFSRRMGVASTLGTRYALNRTAYSSGEFTSHALLADWGASLGRFALLVRGGGSLQRSMDSTARASAEPPPELQLLPVGDLTLSRRQGSLVASLVAGHTVSATLGIGRVLETDHVGASIERVAPRGTYLRAGVDHAWSTDPTAASLRLRALTVGVDLRRPLFTPATFVSAGGFLRQRDFSTGRVASQGVTLSVGTFVGR